MKYKEIQIVYFSPTHTSAKIAENIAKGIAADKIEITDLTLDRGKDDIKIENRLMIIAVPVYAGRVAPTALERIQRLKGNHTPAILAVTYGNRDYEDSLVELYDLLMGQGFIPISAGAFIGEHSYSRKNMPIAEGRPCDDDLACARQFGQLSIQKLDESDSLDCLLPFSVKGNRPYKEVGISTPATPLTIESQCTVCEHCLEVCPTDALFINLYGMIESDKIKCIKCCACVKECPSGARLFDTPYTAMLHEKCAVPRHPELFL